MGEQDPPVTIEPLSEIDKLRFQVLNARHRAAFLERENLLLQFITNNIAAKQATSMMQSLDAERTALMAQWCSNRNLAIADYAVDEETGRFVKVAH